MGRIKTAQVKRITKQLMAAHAAEFSTDFSKNKEIVSRHTDITSTKIRNVVAGYAARLVKQQQAQSGPRRAVHKEDLSQYY
ncbi:TPA: 30S ribosomal protein S17e [Candidatus Woesearchaeota archaeon]|nr:30S ribosomal protein S17e [Candidatus Woesearchaeota archaeon]HIH91558.1 30S ribosomal protein S17e [Candidatus Woesearchaeota archaeon]HII63915.1 30S ribosomal protein S17e [Candidatus Woesearchaeota archaeon]HII66369.1 30S ribosomal protein S17e [Candidatus Woesearchaeota archaeon]